jgi:hypothetical protein
LGGFEGEAMECVMGLMLKREMHSH